MKWSIDPHPFDHDGTFAIVTISAMSILQAGLLVFRPISGHATAIFALLVAFNVVIGNHPNIVGALMVGSAILALAAALLRMGRARLAIFAPQQLLLFVMALGGLEAAREGMYLDGTVIDWSHILSDQIITAAMFAIHWNATVRRARDPNG